MSRGMQRPKHVTEQALPNPKVYAVGAHTSTAAHSDMYSASFLKAHFGAHEVVIDEQECDDAQLREALERIAPLYDKLCTSLPFTVDRTMLERELDWLEPETLERLVSQPSAAATSKKMIRSQLQMAEQKAIQQNRAAIVGKRHALVLYSGGVSSIAALSATLQREDVDQVYLCYLVRVDRSNAEREVASLLNVLRYGRDSDGRPFVSNVDKPASEALRSPSAKIRVLPMPSQPYTLTTDDDGTTQEAVARCGIKHHPITYLLIYRQALVAAHAFNCDEIVWGLYGNERALIECAHAALFSTIQPHSNSFPHSTRAQAYDEFCRAARHGVDVWSHIDKQQTKDSSSGSHASKGPVRTESACVMADAAHWAWTCASAAGSRLVAQQPNQGESENEEPAHQFAKRRLVQDSDNATQSLLPANWCGRCVDCAPWLAAVYNNDQTESLATAVNGANHKSHATALAIGNQYATTLLQSVWSQSKPPNVPLNANAALLRRTLAPKPISVAGKKRQHKQQQQQQQQPITTTIDEEEADEKMTMDDVLADEEEYEDGDAAPLEEEEQEDDDDENDEEETEKSDDEDVPQEEEDEEEEIDDAEENADEVDDDEDEEDDDDDDDNGEDREPRDSAESNGVDEGENGDDEEEEEEDEEGDGDDQWDEEIEDDNLGDDDLGGIGDDFGGADDDGGERGDYDY